MTAHEYAVVAAQEFFTSSPYYRTKERFMEIIEDAIRRAQDDTLSITKASRK